jgi:hypothetical protein
MNAVLLAKFLPISALKTPRPKGMGRALKQASNLNESPGHHFGLLGFLFMIKHASKGGV